MLPVTSCMLYFLSMTILTQRREHSVPDLILGIARVLDDVSYDTLVVDSFKVTGEAKVIAVVEVSNIAGLENIVSRVWQLGEILVNAQPVIDMINFTQNIGAGEIITTPIRGTLQKDSLFWEEIDVEYHGKSTAELLSVWKEHAELVMGMRNKGQFRLEFYKALAVRKVYIFLNIPDPARYDTFFYQLPFLRDNGANIHVKMKAVQFLKDYVETLSTKIQTDC